MHRLLCVFCRNLEGQVCMASFVMRAPTVSYDLKAKALEIREKYGPAIGWPELLRILQDRDCVPFHCEVEFDADPLLPGEFGHLARRGVGHEDGYTIYIHPVYQFQLSEVPYLVLHQVALVSSGNSASPEQAERFGATVLGITQDEYYNTLCELAAQVGGDDLC